jgi:isoaspartyl peptidase/L-asparaginase-like protein (Ntn-hydrolase superfamily)
MMMQPIIVAHGGVGAPPEYSDGAEKAVRLGYDILKRGGKLLDAVVTATVALEDDMRFNAGTGSYCCLDGIIEMDAAIMDSKLRCGAVIGIRNVKNPIKVARAVMDTPHIILAGDGARAFARKLGFRYYNPMTEKANKKLLEVRKKLRTGGLPIWVASRWRKFAIDKFIASPQPDYSQYKVSGTVGVVARDKYGNFAATNSTGGTSLKLRGRVGDTPIFGAGLYVSTAGAVTVTGVGEEIIKRCLAKTLIDRLETTDAHPQAVCEWGIAQFPKRIPIGIIAVSKKGWGIAASKQMAAAWYPL